jgi:hypothetical protein
MPGLAGAHDPSQELGSSDLGPITIDTSTGHQTGQDSFSIPATAVSIPLETLQPELYVFLIVKAGVERKLAQITVSTKSTADFFQALREEYIHKRGGFRSWLSVWQYSHCDFNRVSHLQAFFHSFVRC